MPLSAVERQAYYNAIETSGIESDIAKATLRARIENIDNGAAGAITRDQFHTEMRNALEAAKVETVVGSKWDAAVTAALGGRVAGDPGNINIALFESTITSGIYPDIRDKVLSSSRDRLADKHIEYFLNSTTRTSQEYVSDLKSGVGFSQEIADRIIARTQQYIDRKVEGIKVQLDAGTLTEAQVRAMISGPTASITNPQLITAISKFLDDPTRVQARKDAADKATIDADAANFKTELDRTAVTGAEIDFDDLTSRITTLPEYATLSGPVRSVVEAHMQNKSEMVQNDRAVLVAKENANDAETRLKTIERNRALIQLTLRRLQWIGVGALAGGALALVLTSGGGLPAIFGGTFQIPGLFGAPGLFPWGGFAIGGAAGAGLTSGLANALDPQLAERISAFQKAQLGVINQNAERTRIIADSHKKEGEALRAYTKIAALVESLTKGVDKDKAVATYLKTSSVDALDALLQV